MAMRAVDAALCVFCVALVSLGQVLLRATATMIGSRGWPAAIGWQSAVAVAVYGSAMLLWLFILTRVPLTVAFAFFGLCFFLVPLLASRMLGDPVSIATWVGASIIIIGVIVTTLGS